MPGPVLRLRPTAASSATTRCQEARHGLSVARHAAVVQVEKDEVQASVLRELPEAAARRLGAALECQGKEQRAKRVALLDAALGAQRLFAEEE